MKAFIITQALELLFFMDFPISMVGLEFSSREKWGRERHEIGELWQSLAYSYNFVQYWVAVLTLTIFEDCWYKAQ